MQAWRGRLCGDSLFIAASAAARLSATAHKLTHNTLTPLHLGIDVLMRVVACLRRQVGVLGNDLGVRTLCLDRNFLNLNGDDLLAAILAGRLIETVWQAERAALGVLNNRGTYQGVM